ncbi:MAG: hypothetical protein Q4C54_08665 [Clostridia bacterium]|nr:hypothetical protein [Clostridia bacterium]
MKEGTSLAYVLVYDDNDNVLYSYPLEITATSPNGTFDVAVVSVELFDGPTEEAKWVRIQCKADSRDVQKAITSGEIKSLSCNGGFAFTAFASKPYLG